MRNPDFGCFSKSQNQEFTKWTGFPELAWTLVPSMHFLKAEPLAGD